MISPQVGKARNHDLTPSRLKYLSVLRCVQTGTGTHPASYFMDTRGSFLAAKHSWHEADHLGPPSAMAKNEGSCTWTVSHMPTWHGQGQLYLHVPKHVVQIPEGHSSYLVLYKPKLIWT